MKQKIKRKEKPFWDRGINPIVGYRVEALGNYQNHNLYIKEPTW